MNSIYPRTEYEMSQEDLDAMMDRIQAARNTPVMMIGGYGPRSALEVANDCWKALGAEMGFDYMTVQPVLNKGSRFFTAIPSEPEDQRTMRLAKESQQKYEENAAALRDQITNLENQLKILIEKGPV